ncbi:MAG TPA: hypothetical protein VGN18_16965 [Jatrophihabitans sp.]|jgi:hypothetical protein|uniref:hypothetical protein n=1 Tax=Jatrophihabitans sp. TaxID=1932789 RepID=UPI002E039531|nr:hypothetical protein [Jatrophihabitans sp.]
MRRADRGRDDGTTLMELVVGMGLMTVFMSMFTTVVLMMNNASSAVSSLRSSTASVNTAFLQLDKAIRYASAMSQPNAAATATGNYYAEFQTTNTGATVCTQLQLNNSTQQLSKRTWTVTGSTYTTPTAFTIIASNVVADPAATAGPFQLNPPASATNPTPDVPFEQLAVALSSTQKLGSATSTTPSSMTFTAVNSSAAYQYSLTTPTAPTTICTGPGRP